MQGSGKTRVTERTGQSAQGTEVLCGLYPRFSTARVRCPIKFPSTSTSIMLAMPSWPVAGTTAVRFASSPSC